MRGSEAKLPNRELAYAFFPDMFVTPSHLSLILLHFSLVDGMEAFGFNNVVRAIMLENAKEYHTLIANVPRLNIDDLICSLKNKVLEEKMCHRGYRGDVYCPCG